MSTSAQTNTHLTPLVRPPHPSTLFAVTLALHRWLRLSRALLVRHSGPVLVAVHRPPLNGRVPGNALGLEAWPPVLGHPSRTIGTPAVLYCVGQF